MKVNFFIDRPVFSAVISILIVIVGIIGLMMLPIDQYPQITPPVVKISASYPGASAVTVSQAVATPIEQELNGTPGMLYMESSSSNTGSFRLLLLSISRLIPTWRLSKYRTVSNWPNHVCLPRWCRMASKWISKLPAS